MEDPVLVVRELKDPLEVVHLIRLRHRIYLEKGFAAQKPLGLDLTAYDQRSRLLGLFRDGELVGGLRLVFRYDQPLASMMRTIRAVVVDATAEQHRPILPSEEGFDLAAEPGLRRELVDVEVGRLVVTRGSVEASVVLRMLVAALAVIIVSKACLYMYSCAVALAKRYALVTNPRWTLESLEHGGIHSDGWPFPSQSRAGIAAAADSPFFGCALQYAAEFAQTGSIALSRALPRVRTNVGFGHKAAVWSRGAR